MYEWVRTRTSTSKCYLLQYSRLS